MRSGGRAVLIILYPRFSHALYLDSSKNIHKKDYTHIKSVLDSAMFHYQARGGEVRDKKRRAAGSPSAIRPTSAASSNRTILLMMDSMSYTTCWSTDRITRTFACHLDLAMPIFYNGQRT